MAVGQKLGSRGMYGCRETGLEALSGLACGPLCTAPVCPAPQCCPQVDHGCMAAAYRPGQPLDYRSKGELMPAAGLRDQRQAGRWEACCPAHCCWELLPCHHCRPQLVPSKVCGAASPCRGAVQRRPAQPERLQRALAAGSAVAYQSRQTNRLCHPDGVARRSTALCAAQQCGVHVAQ